MPRSGRGQILPRADVNRARRGVEARLRPDVSARGAEQEGGGLGRKRRGGWSRLVAPALDASGEIQRHERALVRTAIDTKPGLAQHEGVVLEGRHADEHHSAVDGDGVARHAAERIRIEATRRPDFRAGIEIARIDAAVRVPDHDVGLVARDGRCADERRSVGGTELGREQQTELERRLIRVERPTQSAFGGDGVEGSTEVADIGVAVCVDDRVACIGRTGRPAADSSKTQSTASSDTLSGPSSSSCGLN